MNMDVKEYAKEKKVKLWQVADVLGITDSKLSRILRYPLDDVMRRNVMAVVDKISEKQN